MGGCMQISGFFCYYFLFISVIRIDNTSSIQLQTTLSGSHITSIIIIVRYSQHAASNHWMKDIDISMIIFLS